MISHLVTHIKIMSHDLFFSSSHICIVIQMLHYNIQPMHIQMCHQLSTKICGKLCIQTILYTFFTLYTHKDNTHYGDMMHYCVTLLNSHCSQNIMSHRGETTQLDIFCRTRITMRGRARSKTCF